MGYPARPRTHSSGHIPTGRRMQRGQQIRQKVGFLQTLNTCAYIYPLFSHRECMRGMVCVAGGVGCGDTGPSRVQEG